MSTYLILLLACCMFTPSKLNGPMRPLYIYIFFLPILNNLHVFVVAGALVSFKCGRRSWSAKTDARGYFLINGKFPLHKDEDMEKYVVQCGKVHVVSTPLPACTVPEFLEHKGKGASVFYEKNIPVGSGYVALFSAGDLYLGPADSKMCHA